MVSPNTDYKDKYSHLIGKVAAKDAAHTMEANKAYGCGECGRGTCRPLGCLQLVAVSSTGLGCLGRRINVLRTGLWGPAVASPSAGGWEGGLLRALASGCRPISGGVQCWACGGVFVLDSGLHLHLSLSLAVPVANKRDTRSIEEAMNEIRAKKRLRQSEEEGPALPTTDS